MKNGIYFLSEDQLTELIGFQIFANPELARQIRSQTLTKKCTKCGGMMNPVLSPGNSFYNCSFCENTEPINLMPDAYTVIRQDGN